MSRFLFVIDLQPEFVKDIRGRVIYNADLQFIRDHRVEYDGVFAAVYKNGSNPNMKKLMRWDEMKEIKHLDFEPSFASFHAGYSPDEYPDLTFEDTVDVIGFDTDACVLSTCFDLFNKGVPFRILANGCWSSGGAKMHKAGLSIMRRQFRAAVDLETEL